ncbi:MAG: membrane protein insertion efficiency factor YidD [Woeseia sp.]|nr:membrane protein insertion efficiency factor YidD [Woeseia sp.]
MSLPLLGLVSVYRVLISPLLGLNCRFQPSCSEYARDALTEYGAWRGGRLACKRIVRCHPWGGSGYDPLPDLQTKTSEPRPIMARETLDPKILKQRKLALARAYNFISRGNREGGFVHLDQYAAQEPRRAAAELWFFHEMLHWKLGDVPLFYAQRLLGDLLDAGEDTAAMKICLRCFQQNPAFRPRLDDVPRLRAAALKLGNRDVADALPP